jgi:hypothetical protein
MLDLYITIPYMNFLVKFPCKICIRYLENDNFENDNDELIMDITTSLV